MSNLKTISGEILEIKVITRVIDILNAISILILGCTPIRKFVHAFY